MPTITVTDADYDSSLNTTEPPAGWVEFFGQTTKPVTANLAFNPADWLYKDDVSVTENSGADLTDHQVLLELTADNFDFTKAQDNGEDIRFTDTDLELLPYWIESWDKAGQTARIWIKIPSIPANDTVTIWFYYGNPSASSASDGTNTFPELFDGFLGDTLDADIWEGDTTLAVVADGTVIVTGTASIYQGINTKTDFGTSVLRFKVKPITGYPSFGYVKPSSMDRRAWNYLCIGSSPNEFQSVDNVASETTLYIYDVGNFSIYEIRWEKDVSVKYYDDDVLKATHTNNPPEVDIAVGLIVWGGGSQLEADWVLVRKYASPEPDCEIKTYGKSTKPIGLNVHVKPAECKTVKNSVEQHGFSIKSITALIQQYGATIKSVIADVVYYSWRTKPVQTKIWWDSNKTLRNVQAKIGEPANTKSVTAKVGFPKTTRPVRLETPSGYNEIWKTVQLKVEKYSELVTRIIVADTRQTAYSYVTKPVVLNIGKFPYNSRPVRLKLLSLGETTKSVRCNVLGVDWQTTRDVSCNVNKSRQIIDVGCNVFLPRSQTIKGIKTNIWWDTGESAKPVAANVVSTYLGTATKSVRVNLPTPGETYRAVSADTQPTHRWTPVSCDIVSSNETHRAVKTNVINKVWAFNWKTIAEKIEKYVEHTKNIRARRKVQAKIHYYEVFNTRPVSTNISVPTASTRAVKLKIHLYSIYGTITDKDGNPVKDATVFLYKRGSGEFVTPKTVKTNYDGSYEIPEVPYGKYYVLAIKLAHDLNFSPIVMNGAHVDVEKNMPCYEVSKDVCIEEILSPIGDVFRFQVIYDETFADGTRITDVLLIWGDLYGNLPTLYRDTDGIFMVESPSSARLTVLHDFWETGGTREEGKDDHFMDVDQQPTTEYPSDVSWFNWKASLYTPNFVGFIVRSVSRADVYTILGLNIGGYYEIPTSPPSDPVPPGQRLPPTGGGVTGGRTVHASASPQPVPGVNVERTPCIEDTHEVFEYCSDGVTEKRWRDCIDGEWVEGSLVCCEGEHEVIEYCLDGVTEKRWQDCVSGEWVGDSLVCCEGEHEVLEYCPDGVTERRWRDCVGGTWVEDSQVCCSPEGAHEILEWCPDGVIVRRWRDCVNGMWVEDSQVCCSPEGAHEVLEYCPDEVTEKKWRDCIGGMWVEDSRVCPIGWIRLVSVNTYVPPSWFRQVRCNVKRSVTCVPTIYLPYTYGPGFDIHPNIMGYILARPQWFQNVKTVTVSIGFQKSTTKQITAKVGIPATSRPVRCTVNHYVAASTKAIQTNIGAPVVASDTKSVSCKLPLFWHGSNSRAVHMNVLKISAYPVPVSGTVLVIDKDTGYLLYVCTVGNDGFYSFSVPPDKCYYLIINKYGYRSRMQEICIGDTSVVDRNTKEYGGDIFDCEINCYYYVRGFEFPALTQALIGKIYGHVYNSRTLEPISNALVIVDDNAWGATTDENGYYEVFVVTGTHEMECSHGKRYKRAEATAVVASDTEQDFYLDPVVRVGITFTGGLTHKPIYL